MSNHLYEASKIVLSESSDDPDLSPGIGALTMLGAALSSQRDEWKKRRELMCVKEPLRWQHDSENYGEFSRVYYKNNQIICDACPTFHDGRPRIHEDEAGLVICAALNLYFGFSADGSVDYLKEGQ